SRSATYSPPRDEDGEVRQRFEEKSHRKSFPMAVTDRRRLMAYGGDGVGYSSNSGGDGDMQR
ncbi:hypothetical protein Tco_0574542, partial [Tanacetum coccineum]